MSNLAKLPAEARPQPPMLFSTLISMALGSLPKGSPTFSSVISTKLKLIFAMAKS